MAGSARPFGILLVCTGNVCRSPVAELLLASRFYADGAAGFTVSSAGTRALAGRPMDPRAEALLPPDVEATGFRARQLEPSMVQAADLVLCMDRGVRAETVRTAPSALKRVFAFREFGRMLRLMDHEAVPAGIGAADKAERWRQLVARAPAVRPLALARQEDDDDVLDPFGGPARQYERMMREIEPALAALQEAGLALRS